MFYRRVHRSLIQFQKMFHFVIYEHKVDPLFHKQLKAGSGKVNNNRSICKPIA